MNGDQAIRVGVLAITRRDVRKVHAGAAPTGATVNFTAPDGSSKSILVDRSTAKAILEAMDLDLSNRLQKMGVSELD